MIFHKKPSFVMKLHLYLFYLLLAILPHLLIPSYIKSYHFSNIYLDQLLSIISFIFLLSIIWQILIVYNISYYLYENRLVIKKGVLSRRREETELYRIIDYSVDVPFIYRIFKKGTVIVYTTDKTDPVIPLKCISNYNQVVDTIRNQVEKVRKDKGVRFIE